MIYFCLSLSLSLSYSFLVVASLPNLILSIRLCEVKTTKHFISFHLCDFFECCTTTLKSCNCNSQERSRFSLSFSVKMFFWGFIIIHKEKQNKKYKKKKQNKKLYIECKLDRCSCIVECCRCATFFIVSFFI
jgi:hypothetical protein